MSKIEEVKNFIESEIYNPYKGYEDLEFDEWGNDGFEVNTERFSFKTDLTWGDCEVNTKKGHSINRYDCEWFMNILDSLPRIQEIWDGHRDEDSHV